MAYHGYIGFISNYCSRIKEKLNRNIKILEIGVDTGITLFALNNNLNLLSVPFEYTGIDIKVQNHVKVLDYTFMQRFETNKIRVIEENSLKYLNTCDEKFDIIMIDGDHNYKTVREELSHLQKISHENTLVVCDDYTGRWSERDLYYADREGYENNKKATKYHDTEKKGVKNAIDDFLLENKNYEMFTIVQGEPVCLINKNNQLIYLRNHNEK